MTKGEEMVIRNVIRRLRGERTSDVVKKAFTVDAALYLETWVIPGLEWLLPETRDVDAAIQQTKL
jgi:hypothetical protein